MAERAGSGGGFGAVIARAASHRSGAGAARTARGAGGRGAWLPSAHVRAPRRLGPDAERALAASRGAARARAPGARPRRDESDARRAARAGRGAGARRSPRARATRRRLATSPSRAAPAAAREAIAAYHRGQGALLAPEHVVLTAGTSEGYAHLFRLLADPGDLVHLPAPGYGLFEHLAALEGVVAERYPLRPPRSGARWRIDLEALAATLTSPEPRGAADPPPQSDGLLRRSRGPRGAARPRAGAGPRDPLRRGIRGRGGEARRGRRAPSPAPRRGRSTSSSRAPRSPSRFPS